MYHLWNKLSQKSFRFSNSCLDILKKRHDPVNILRLSDCNHVFFGGNLSFPTFRSSKYGTSSVLMTVSYLVYIVSWINGLSVFLNITRVSTIRWPIRWVIALFYWQLLYNGANRRENDIFTKIIYQMTQFIS